MIERLIKKRSGEGFERKGKRREKERKREERRRERERMCEYDSFFTFRFFSGSFWSSFLLGSIFAFGLLFFACLIDSPGAHGGLSVGVLRWCLSGFSF